MCLLLKNHFQVYTYIHIHIHTHTVVNLLIYLFADLFLLNAACCLNYSLSFLFCFSLRPELTWLKYKIGLGYDYLKIQA